MWKGRRHQHQPSFQASEKLAIVCYKSARQRTRVHSSVNSGCSQTLVSKAICCWWRQEEVGVPTADGRTLKCRGYSKIKLALKQASPMIVEVLVIDRQLLGFDLLLGIDVIKELRGVHLTESGEACFRNPNRCAAISINEPDFSVTFDWSTKA